MFGNLFKTAVPEKLDENFFRLINKDWMLITAGKSDHFNTMTASWGSTGILWNKPIAICFIRPHRYTFEFAEKYEFFTLSFFDSRHKGALNYCGAHSGRNVDKMAGTGLTPVATPFGNVTYEESRLVIECKKLYSDFLKEQSFIEKKLITQNYPQRDFHKFFIGEIVACYQK